MTYTIAQASFEVVAISSISFTAPSKDRLMGLVNARKLLLSFGPGLVRGEHVGWLLERELVDLVPTPHKVLRPDARYAL